MLLLYPYEPLNIFARLMRLQDSYFYRRGDPGKDEKIPRGHRKDVNTAVGDIDNLARCNSVRGRELGLARRVRLFQPTSAFLCLPLSRLNVGFKKFNHRPSCLIGNFAQLLMRKSRVRSGKRENVSK